MPGYVRHEPDRLAVVFERDGERPIRIEADDGEKATIRAVALLLAHRRLLAGDRLKIEPA